MMKLNELSPFSRKTFKIWLLIIYLTLTTFSVVMLKLMKNINNIIQNVFPRDKITIAFSVFYKVLLVFILVVWNQLLEIILGMSSLEIFGQISWRIYLNKFILSNFQIFLVTLQKSFSKNSYFDRTTSDGFF